MAASLPKLLARTSASDCATQLFTFGERADRLIGICRNREQFGGCRKGNGKKPHPFAVIELNLRQRFHKSSFVCDRDHRGHARRTAPQKAAASPATGTSEEECLHLLAYADQGAIDQAMPRWCVQTPGRWTASVGLQFTWMQERRALPLPARKASGERHRPCGTPNHNDLARSRNLEPCVSGSTRIFP